MQLIAMNENATRGSKDVIYACQNWCYHLASALSYHSNFDTLDTQGGNTAVLIGSMEKQWIRRWMYELEDVDHLHTICKDCTLAVQRMEVRLMWKCIGICILIRIEHRRFQSNGKLL
jgi:hypothetical protein